MCTRERKKNCARGRTNRSEFVQVIQEGAVDVGADAVHSMVLKQDVVHEGAREIELLRTRERER